MKRKVKKRTILFWIRSNRGTNAKAIFNVPSDWSKKEIVPKLEHWCSHYGAWTHSDNIIHYGYRGIKVPNRKELKERWNKLCNRKHSLENRWLEMREMFNVRDLINKEVI